MSTSEISASTCSLPEAEDSDSPMAMAMAMRIQTETVTKPVSDRLLTKFYDVSEYGFDHAQSGLWSPPVKRSAFLSSPAGYILTEREMQVKLSALEARHQQQQRRLTGCFNAFWCSPKTC